MKVEADKLVNTAGDLFGIYQVLGIRTFPEEIPARRDARCLCERRGSRHRVPSRLQQRRIQHLRGRHRCRTVHRRGRQRKEELLARLTDEEGALVESYCQSFKDDNYEPLSCLIGQMLFITPQIRVAEELAKANNKSYTYLWRVESSVPLMKAGHATEVSTVLAHPELCDLTGRRYDETFGKTVRKMWVQFATCGNPSLCADISPDGKAHEWPPYDLEDKEVMVLDEFDIHPEREADLKIVDWDRTYFLNRYYMP
jgi:para-nitrobenzyl esterase